MALTDGELREAASHRGLKLVKSRKRKPGTGDYGLFGLTDASDAPLFGVSDDGLTATAEEIADFLRKGEASTWAASAKSTPARPKSASSVERSSPDVEEEPPLEIKPRRRTPTSGSGPETRQHARPTRSTPAEKPRDQNPQPKARPAPAPKSDPVPEPVLVIRSARPDDAAGVRTLAATLGFKRGIGDAKQAIAACAARKEPLLIADRGGVVGCLGWHIVPTLQHGDMARITMIVVTEGQRRQGIGRALYAAALAEFGKRKVRSIEAMSDIEVRNANGFYRALGLKQVSYRFAAEI
jgi:ribosomal protein S18 acetylase RimI-like enzyme